MLRFLAYLLLIGLTSACREEKSQLLIVEKKAQTSVRDSSSTPFFIAEPLIKSEVYDLDETLDPNFCDQDSLIEGDCNGGILYFTPKGNVIFQYLCMGDTTVGYYVGKQITQKSGTSIRFFEIYKYHYQDETKNPSIKINNSGKKEKIEFQMNLIKVKNCDGYLSTIYNDEKYVIKKSTKFSTSDEIIKEISKIEVLKKY